MTNDKYCVYMHKNKINGKVYIGKSIDHIRRWRNNGIEYKPYKENTRPFWNAICKYGWDGFEHIILKENLSDEEASRLEIEYIEKFNSRSNKFGYNVAEGGNGGRIYKEHPKGMLGKKHSQEKKDKQRELAKRLVAEGKLGNNWSYEEHPRGMLGKTHSEEYKKKLSVMFSGANNHQAIKLLAIMPDGSKIIFDTKKQLMNELKISQGVVDRLRKSGQPYEIKTRNQHTEKTKHLEGLIIKDITENTEITNRSKELLVS